MSYDLVYLSRASQQNYNELSPPFFITMFYHILIKLMGQGATIHSIPLMEFRDLGRAEKISELFFFNTLTHTCFSQAFRNLEKLLSSELHLIKIVNQEIFIRLSKTKNIKPTYQGRKKKGTKQPQGQGLGLGHTASLLREERQRWRGRRMKKERKR